MQLYFMHWQKSGSSKVPKTWMKNPEKWQKLGKINPKKPSQKLIARHLVKSGSGGVGDWGGGPTANLLVYFVFRKTKHRINLLV